LKAAAFEAAFLEFPARPAWAKVVAPQLFDQFLIATDNAKPTLDVRFAVESPPAFAHRLKS